MGRAGAAAAAAGALGALLAAAAGAAGAAAAAGGHCLSENPFSGPDSPDCVQFGGDLGSAQAACESGELSMPGATGEWAAGACSTYESEVYAGECVYETENGAEARQVMLLEGRATCQFLGSIVCGTFIPGGTWKPTPLCGGADEAAAGEAAVDSGADEDTDADEGTDAGAQAGDTPSEGGAACPPEGFDAVADLNLTAWAEAPWYPLAQMPLAYQGVETFFCVRASYKILDESTVQVQNTAEEEDGTPSPGDDSPFQFLRAVVQDPKEPAKLAVGPPSLPPEMYGSYWVVAAGSASQEGNGTDASFTLSDGPPEGPFDWGIVSGGAPKDPSPGGGCVAGTPGGFNEAGLWLFSREPLAGAEAEAMRAAVAAKASALGLGAGALEPVRQGADASCEYPPVLPAAGGPLD